MPTPYVFESGKWHIAGCEPDFPKHRDWGCCNCNAAFFKDTSRNKAAPNSYMASYLTLIYQ